MTANDNVLLREPGTPQPEEFSASPRPPRARRVLRYGLAVTIVAVATALRVWLVSTIGPGPTYITWYPAVIIAATLGGGGPGVLATFLSAIAADYFLLEPQGIGIGKLGDVVALGLFMSCGLLISGLAERFHRARWAEAINVGLRQANEELEQMNADLQAREEEIAAQNEELQQQSEELAHQSEELQQQSDELQRQSEELQSQNEELESRAAALQASEHRVRAKLDSILSPEGDIGTLELADVIDTPAVQSLVDDLHSLNHVPVGIIDVKGKVLVGAGWQDVCTRFHRVNRESCRYCIESDTELTTGVPVGEFRVYKCKNGLWDVATPIVVGGKHLGNIFTGQFLFEGEEPDLELFRAQARHFGYNEKEYIAALLRVPRFSREQVHAAMSAFVKLANMLSQLSYSNIELARSLNTRDTLMHSVRESEARLLRLNRTLLALGKSNQALIRAESEAALLDEVCRIIAEDCGYAMVWIGYAEEDNARSVRPVAYAGFEQGYLETLNITWADDERGRGPTGTAIRTGRPCMCRNMQTDPQFAPWRSEAVRRGYNSSLVLPLIGDERPFGALSIYSREADGFIEEDAKLLSRLASDLAYGITAIRVRDAHARAEEALRDSEERLRAAAMAGEIGVWSWKPGTEQVEVRANWRRLFGVEPATQVTFETWKNALHPEDRDAAVASLKAAAEGSGEYNVEYRVLRPDGSIRWVVDRGRATYDESGRAVSMAGVNVDMTERKRMEEELRHSRDRLGDALEEARVAKEVAEAASAAKDHFLAVLSHELRTPLAPVLMTASALEGDGSVPEWIREDMALIRRSVDLEVRLIDDLLDLNRISRGKLELRMETLDAHNKVIAAVDICRLDSREKGLVLETLLDADEHHVSADGGRLQQILWNLLKNAIKFTPKAGQITIRSYNRDGMFCVDVADTGVGISAEALPNVFTAFEQGGREITRQFGGLGLGLAISKALIEMHGGRISGRSEGPGKGATFTVELPVVLRPEAVRPKMPAKSAKQAPKLRILLVEDNAATLMVLEKLLTRAGYDVQTAGNVRDGIRTALESDIDLLISDLGLPDGSGLDLMRELRVAKPDLPAIALSGYGMEADIERSLQAGFSEHLIKPVEMPALQAAIARVRIRT